MQGVLRAAGELEVGRRPGAGLRAQRHGTEGAGRDEREHAPQPASRPAPRTISRASGHSAPATGRTGRQDSLLLGREISGRALAQHVEQVDVEPWARVQVFHRLPVGQGRVSEVKGTGSVNADEIEKVGPEARRECPAARRGAVAASAGAASGGATGTTAGRSANLLSGVDLPGRRRRGLELGREVLAHPPIRGEHAPICDFDVAHGQ